MKVRLPCVCFLSAVGACCCTKEVIPADNVPCAALDDSTEAAEYNEVTAAQVELLQVQVKHTKTNNSGTPRTGDRQDLGNRQDLETTGGNHRYFLCRPCARLAGDGMSGLPRHLVTGECCGDSVCSPAANWESHETCPEDCEDVKLKETQENKSQVLSPPTKSNLFGTLPGMPHDVYHCSTADGEHVSGCSKKRDYSVWLDTLLDRAKNGTLPFDLPPPGSIAVELGCGKGQDSRNIASKAGYALTAVDVSPGAIEEAKSTTPQELLGSGPGQIEFVAYDALALPDPVQRVDFFFDATVYCELRHEYLARLYGVWSRLFTPGHTLVHIQCWNWEFSDMERQIIPRTHRDMEADFEPFFNILHSEACEKNQDGPGWCFYMQLKAGEIREHISEERLKIQKAARDGDIEYVSQNLPRLTSESKEISGAYITTLYYIAMFNSHVSLMKYLDSVSPKRQDSFFTTVYGTDADVATVEAEDRFLSNMSADARRQLAYLKADWERAEAELILQKRLDMSTGTSM